MYRNGSDARGAMRTAFDKAPDSYDTLKKWHIGAKIIAKLSARRRGSPFFTPGTKCVIHFHYLPGLVYGRIPAPNTVDRVMIPGFLDRALEKAPEPISAYYDAYKVYRWSDPYIRLVARLADRSRLALDIGAHRGDYVFFMRRHAAACVAFECNPSLVAHLRRRYGVSVEIRFEAVSDQQTTTVLRIPKVGGDPNLGRATIDPGNPLEGEFSSVDLVPVMTVRLDDVIDRPVGLLKIDVEGHERAVLRGARRILRQDRPNLIVELEDRHAPGCIEEVIGFLRDYSYRPFFLQSGQLREAMAGQGLPGGLWNFVFIADGGRDRGSSLRG